MVAWKEFRLCNQEKEKDSQKKTKANKVKEHYRNSNRNKKDFRLWNNKNNIESMKSKLPTVIKKEKVIAGETWKWQWQRKILQLLKKRINLVVNTDRDKIEDPHWKLITKTI